MLELTRRVGEMVLLGEAHELRVTAIAPRIVSLQLTRREEYFLSGPLQLGTSFTFEVDGQNVTVHAIAIFRGEVRLGFEAPREIAIERPERAGQEPCL